MNRVQGQGYKPRDMSANNGGAIRYGTFRPQLGASGHASARLTGRLPMPCPPLSRLASHGTAVPPAGGHVA